MGKPRKRVSVVEIAGFRWAPDMPWCVVSCVWLGVVVGGGGWW